MFPEKCSILGLGDTYLRASIERYCGKARICFRRVNCYCFFAYCCLFHCISRYLALWRLFLGQSHALCDGGGTMVDQESNEQRSRTEETASLLSTAGHARRIPGGPAAADL